MLQQIKKKKLNVRHFHYNQKGKLSDAYTTDRLRYSDISVIWNFGERDVVDSQMVKKN